MKPSDILFVLRDEGRDGGFLSIFTDIEEAKRFSQLYVRQVCGEKVKLKWEKKRKGIITSSSKYQTYTITEVTREDFENDMGEYIY